MFKILHSALLVAILFQLLIVNGADEISDNSSFLTVRDKLQHYLDDMHYDKRNPPLNPPTVKRIRTYVLIQLHKIAEVDNARSRIGVLITLFVLWFDHRLRYDDIPEFNRTLHLIPYVRRSAGSVWKPDIRIINQLNSEVNINFRDNHPVQLFKVGMLATEKTMFLYITCSFNMENFPCDVNVCQLKIAPSDMSSDEVLFSDTNDSLIELDVKNFVLERYQDSEEWILEKKDITLGQIEKMALLRPHGNIDRTNYVFEIKIRRNAVFYIVIAVFPLFMLGLVALVSFILPPQIGPQKVIVPVSVLISLNVFILLLERILPKTMNIPYIAIVIAVLMITCCVTEIIEAFVLKLYHTPASCHMKPCIQWLFFRFLCWFAFMPMTNGKNGKAGPASNVSNVHVNEWQLASKILDRVGLLLCSTSFVVIIIFVLSVLSKSC